MKKKQKNKLTGPIAWIVKTALFLFAMYWIIYGVIILAVGMFPLGIIPGLALFFGGPIVLILILTAL